MDIKGSNSFKLKFLIVGISLSLFIFSACRPSPTAALLPTSQAIPTSDLSNLIDIDQKVLVLASDILEQHPSVEDVQYAEWDEGKLDIEILVATNNQDEQFEAAYNLALELARVLEEQLGINTISAESPEFNMGMTTISQDGLEVLVTEHSAELLSQMATQNVTLDEWGLAANARFP
ncbi:MAG: hypothetical protein DWQ07_24615 [Chloroflexi bacterium]|nr:MAG: hypothetical protein DWQ07_24615 [Chloroflexota bacterium]MBL1196317.1 hypothetical protein [Chloroflexota bacterium]NOH13612.1 hypothetical protein [Chloroflexota bacterium]